MASTDYLSFRAGGFCLNRWEDSCFRIELLLGGSVGFLVGEKEFTIR